MLFILLLPAVYEEVMQSSQFVCVIRLSRITHKVVNGFP